MSVKVETIWRQVPACLSFSLYYRDKRTYAYFTAIFHSLTTNTKSLFNGVFVVFPLFSASAFDICCFSLLPTPLITFLYEVFAHICLQPLAKFQYCLYSTFLFLQLKFNFKFLIISDSHQTQKSNFY